MPFEVSELDQLQLAYKAAVDQWIAAIREEEALASVDHSEAEVDAWDIEIVGSDIDTQVLEAARCGDEFGFRAQPSGSRPNAERNAAAASA